MAYNAMYFEARPISLAGSGTGAVCRTDEK